MIQPYAFIDANATGNKERRLTQNTLLYNKLSAVETNNFKNKINEIVVALNSNLVAAFNTFKFIQKGFNKIDLNNFEAGDIFCGWSNDGTIRFTEAVYLGGLLTDSNNFTPLVQTSLI